MGYCSVSEVMTDEYSHHVSRASLSVVGGSAYSECYHNAIARWVHFAVARWDMRFVAPLSLVRFSMSAVVMVSGGDQVMV